MQRLALVLVIKDWFPVRKILPDSGDLAFAFFANRQVGLVADEQLLIDLILLARLCGSIERGVGYVHHSFGIDS